MSSKLIQLISTNLVRELSSVLCSLQSELTDDYASDGAGVLDVTGLLCKHALTTLQQGDVALDVLAVGELAAAAVGFGYSHKASYLHKG